LIRRFFCLPVFAQSKAMAESMDVDTKQEVIGINDEDLFRALEAGDSRVFEKLSRNEVDLNRARSIRNEDARFVIHVAAAAGHHQVVHILAGLDPSVSGVNNGDEEGWTPLHSSVSSGHANIVEEAQVPQEEYAPTVFSQ
jgi:26S proteasome non-ATPase regulatory subunit 10